MRRFSAKLGDDWEHVHTATKEDEGQMFVDGDGQADFELAFSDGKPRANLHGYLVSKDALTEGPRGMINGMALLAKEGDQIWTRKSPHQGWKIHHDDVGDSGLGGFVAFGAGLLIGAGSS